MGIFDGIGAANARGNGSTKGEYFQPGTYRVAVQRHILKDELMRGKFEGESAVIVETTIKEVLNTGCTVDGEAVAPNNVGAKATAMFILQRKKSGELTTFGEIMMERLKGHFAACLDADARGVEVNEELLEKLFEAGEEVLSGTELFVEATQRMTRPKDGRPGTAITELYWKRAPQSA